MRIIDTEKVPILVWDEAANEATLDQARDMANLPGAFHHVALMPDAHVGYGVPIGGVLATRDRVIPHAVGLDIGCGVRAWRTNVPVEEFGPALDSVLNHVLRSVPTGSEWHIRSQRDLTDLFDDVPDVPALQAQVAKAELQLGSLGGGNHFVELQADLDGIVWGMVHSGSRNVGKQVAEYFDRVARDINRRGGSNLSPELGLADLAIDGEIGRDYVAAMRWCMLFAFENRRLIAEGLQGAIERRFPGAEPEPYIDVHHNYASIEEHFGERVVVHRKGAVRARGTVLVPGSMGTASYVGAGLANPDAFESCSHGAGRLMSRREAVRVLPREAVLEELSDRGVHLFKRDKADVAEEAPEAYKDIEDVMRWQSDLVEPIMRLRPLGVVKG
jgi:tRNA-splicing ligase RtcB (3'-phosphate/5'-hydroxy nucleic acid ligase)